MAALAGKIALVTGGTDGIGREVVWQLAREGIKALFIVGRSATKATILQQQLAMQFPALQVTFWAADLSLLQEVQRIANILRGQPLDLVIHSAGVMLRRRTLTAQGLETVFAVQYLARFLLIRELLPTLAANARIVNISAGGETKKPLDFDNLQGEKFYSGVWALQHESIANDLQMLEWQTRYPQFGFYCYGPGFVRTTLLRDMPWLLRTFSSTFGQFIAISPEQAAAEVVHLLTGNRSGGLYKRGLKPNPPTAFAANPLNRQRLWAISEALIAPALQTTAS